jgi:DNA-binding XRE family transcriptional regulator
VKNVVAVGVDETGSNGATGVDAVTLGQRIRHLRRTRNMTLADLAGRVGAASSALSTIENGRR